MIQGFTYETKPLSPSEKEDVVPAVVRMLQDRVGKHNSITNEEICEGLRSRGYKASNARMRKIINHIRITGLVKCLVATSNGYYIATSRQEVEEYLRGLESRECAIHEVRNSIESQMKFL